MPKLDQVLKAALTQDACGWNMGSFGAIAEFHHVEGDPDPQKKPGLLQVTDRGGVRIDTLNGVRPVAYETLSPRPHRWTQALSLCLPRDQAAMNQRQVLTALGPDLTSLRDQDRGAELFDMGLGQYQVDFCIRTKDPNLLAVLHENVVPNPCDHLVPPVLLQWNELVHFTVIFRLNPNYRILQNHQNVANLQIDPHVVIR